MSYELNLVLDLKIQAYQNSSAIWSVNEWMNLQLKFTNFQWNISTLHKHYQAHLFHQSRCWTIMKRKFSFSLLSKGAEYQQSVTGVQVYEIQYSHHDTLYLLNIYQAYESQSNVCA